MHRGWGSLYGRAGGIALLIVSQALPGCNAGGGAPAPSNSSNSLPLEDGNQDLTITSPSGKTRGEPNDTFPQAMLAVFDNGVARLQGNIESAADLDVFVLGALNPGDRLIVDVSTPDRQLDASIAIFDDTEAIVFDNDDRSDTSLDSFADTIIRHASDPYYVVIGHSAFAASDARSGSYRMTLTVTSGSPVPPPEPQTVVLDFDGGPTPTDNLLTNFVNPFDAGRISSQYAGRTDDLKSLITARVRDNFAAFEVTVLTSDDPEPPRPYSAILIGSFNPQAFGIAQEVDHYNMDRCDDGVVFAESFKPALFSTPLTVEQLGRAIGNVTSHEIGHLLGLNHVTDPTAIMDGASPADTFILDQRFKRGPLSRDILRIGFQDDPLLLDEGVGPR
ncbi:MAG TPA: matrixin family metalloprotease [Phycisphaerae bacterium]